MFVCFFPCRWTCNVVQRISPCASFTCEVYFVASVPLEKLTPIKDLCPTYKINKLTRLRKNYYLHLEHHELIRFGILNFGFSFRTRFLKFFLSIVTFIFFSIFLYSLPKIQNERAPCDYHVVLQGPLLPHIYMGRARD